MLAAFGLVLQAAPVLAGHHQGGEKGTMKKEWIAKADANGDGIISKEEFLMNAEEKFKMMDTDGSGDVSQEEMMEHHKAKKEKMKGKMQEKRSQKSE